MELETRLKYYSKSRDDPTYRQAETVGAADHALACLFDYISGSVDSMISCSCGVGYTHTMQDDLK